MNWPGRREEEPEDLNWYEATWETHPGYARRVSKKEGGNWQFSAELPADTEPSSVILVHSGNSYGPEIYNVSFRKIGSLRWNLIELPETTGMSNRLAVFGAHVVGNFDEPIAKPDIGENPPLKL